jgi:hypothetical protein
MAWYRDSFTFLPFPVYIYYYYYYYYHYHYHYYIIYTDYFFAKPDAYHSPLDIGTALPFVSST